MFYDIKKLTELEKEALSIDSRIPPLRVNVAEELRASSFSIRRIPPVLIVVFVIIDPFCDPPESFLIARVALVIVVSPV